jgi:hypothetical protein
VSTHAIFGSDLPAGDGQQFLGTPRPRGLIHGFREPVLNTQRPLPAAYKSSERGTSDKQTADDHGERGTHLQGAPHEGNGRSCC